MRGRINVYQGLMSFLPSYVKRDLRGFRSACGIMGLTRRYHSFLFYSFFRRLHDNEHLLFHLDSFLLVLGDESVEHALQ